MNLESKEDKLLLAQLADKQRQCEQRQYPVCSDFLDPRQQALAQAAFAKRVACCFWGGYAEAERRLLAFLPDYISQEEAAQDSSLLRTSLCWCCGPGLRLGKVSFRTVIIWGHCFPWVLAVTRWAIFWCGMSRRKARIL